MSKSCKIAGVGFVILGLMLIAGTSLAFTFSTCAGDIDIVGKVYSQASWRTEDSEGFTSPETDSWDLIQHRNFGLVELGYKPNENFKFFLSERVIYDGLHDYGADQFEPFTDDDIVTDLREAYMDLTYGRIFCRIGQQNLSWGETDLFRLLDGINPLDNTFGIIYEDFDERRIPLKMARMNIECGDMGFLTNLTLEGFIASGRVQSPLADTGTPYAVPAPVFPLPVYIDKPDHGDVRWGTRLVGVTEGVTWSLGHYLSYPDNPTPALRSDPSSLYIEYDFQRQQTTGGSFTFFTGWNLTQSIVRGEFAYTWDEKVFNPTQTMVLPGEIPDAGVFKWNMGLDNNVFFKPLNKRNTFFISLQAFGRHIASDWDTNICVPAAHYPSISDFVRAKKDEYIFTGVFNTKYMDGNLTPEVQVAYDVAGATFLQPSLKYRYQRWEGMLRYSLIDGNFYSFGFFEDRDQLSLRLTYYFG